MNKTIALTLGIGLSLFAIGCTSDVERLVELEEAKAAGYTDAGDDCDKAAKARVAFNEKYGDEYKKLSEKLKEKYKDDKEASEKAIEPYKDRIEKSKKVTVGMVMKCLDNEAFGKAIKNK